MIFVTFTGEDIKKDKSFDLLRTKGAVYKTNVDFFYLTDFVMSLYVRA